MVTTLQAYTLAIALTAAGQVPADGQTVLLDFTSDQCGPCNTMRPLVERLAAEGFPIRQVDVRREPGLAARYRVTSIPCFVLVVDGIEVDRTVGVVDFERLAQMARQTRTSHDRPAASAGGTTPPPGVLQPVSFPSRGPAAGRRPAAPVAATHGEAADQDPALLQATVRIRVDDSTGRSYGTGTIIDARDGQALVLTCGHLFRQARDSDPILVDLFLPTGAKTVQGTLVSYDLNRDLGLLTICPEARVQVAPVAPAGLKVSRGDRVANVGCNNGQEPTVRQTHVTAIDRYDGPSNIEAAGTPVEGRSGGGLFDLDGRLIGVCFAADPAYNEGLYAGLDSIHAELQRLGLSNLCANPVAAAADTATQVAQQAPPPVPRQMPNTAPVAPAAALQDRPVPVAAVTTTAAPVPLSAAPAVLSSAEQTALAEIRRRSQGTELICIVRPADPNEKSEIFVLQNVSSAFIDQLTQSQRPRRVPQLTSMEVPKRTRDGHRGSHRELADAHGWQAKR